MWLWIINFSCACACKWRRSGTGARFSPFDALILYVSTVYVMPIYYDSYNNALCFYLCGPSPTTAKRGSPNADEDTDNSLMNEDFIKDSHTSAEDNAKDKLIYT